MTRKPLFWILFSALGLAGFVVAVWLFPRALPIVELDIEMDQAGAVDRAAVLAVDNGWDPVEARSAATFGQLDSEVQTYVELEGGGRDAFVNLAAQDIYHPYVWTVRRFQEGAIEETVVRFTPSGRAYGFRLRLSEDDPGGGNLTDAEALAVAEAAAAEWGVDLAPFDLLESSQETLPGGRVDHTIVFERGDVDLGEASFRLRIGVSGDRASELAHFVQVPEAFSQRFADMRAANDSIALASQGVFLLVFGIVAAGVGTVVLLRQRWVLWRAALAWGAVTGLLLGLNALNALPLAWIGYDTAVSAGVFLVGQIGVAAVWFLAGTPLLAFFYLAGESLGRRAFPHHLRQWRFWSPEVAGSNAALGRTVGAYLLAGMQLGYVVLFYLGTSRLDGWWSPAESLVQPDLLSTYQPWLLAVSNSLLAAFWEESLFRAVPIACAALIGARYGRPGVWIWATIVVQAVVFAAAHANYPQQPAYARVIELTLPALVWGVVYLYYGLVPTILAHFTYDLALFSIPLFASDAPGVVFDRAVVILVGLLPLGIVLNARRKGRARADAPDWAYNRAWSPPEPPAAPAEEPVSGAEAPPVAPPPARLPVPRSAVYVLGALGAVLWVYSLVPTHDAPTLELSRAEAIETARAALEAAGSPVDGWTPLVATPSQRGNDHRYVFEEAGESVYASLLGRYLGESRWLVRFIDFGADAEDRVEEYQVHVGADGVVGRVRHVLPEARDGARLDEDAARALASSTVEERFGLDAGGLEEVGAEETSRPNRGDWVFTFDDPDALPGVEAAGRVVIEVAGDQVADARRFVNVPEEWERDRRDAATRRSFIDIGLIALLVLIIGVADVVGIVALAKGRVALRVMLIFLSGVLAVMVLSQANAWPALAGQFVSAQPWGLQAGIAAFGIALAAVVVAAGVALPAALGHAWHQDNRAPAAPGLAIALGFVPVGLAAAAGTFSGSFGSLPAWPDPSGAVAYMAVASGLSGPIVPYVLYTALLLFLAGLAVRPGVLPRAALVVAVLALGFAAVPESARESTAIWVLAGVGGAAVAYLLVRFASAAPVLAPGMIAVFIGVDSVTLSVDAAYPGARIGGILGIIVIAAMAAAWTRALSRL